MKSLYAFSHWRVVDFTKLKLRRLPGFVNRGDIFWGQRATQTHQKDQAIFRSERILCGDYILKCELTLAFILSFSQVSSEKQSCIL